MVNMYNRVQLRKELSRDEGRRNHPYFDSKGILTVGVGWNLKANGISEAIRALLDMSQGDPYDHAFFWSDEAIDALLDIGIDEAEKVVGGLVPKWKDMTDERQRALLNMAFNMGKGDGKHGLSSFHHFLAAVNSDDWDGAVTELDATHSAHWHADIGPRADRLMAMFSSDYQDTSTVA